jgi:hypothetical protein
VSGLYSGGGSERTRAWACALVFMRPGRPGRAGRAWELQPELLELLALLEALLEALLDDFDACPEQ